MDVTSNDRNQLLAKPVIFPLKSGHLFGLSSDLLIFLR